MRDFEDIWGKKHFVLGSRSQFFRFRVILPSFFLFYIIILRDLARREVSNLNYRQDHCWCILVGIYHVLKFKLRELLLWRGCVIWAKWALYCYFRAFRFKTGPLSQKCTWQVCVLCWFFGRSLIYVFKKVWHYALYTFVKSVQIDELH